MSYSEEVQRKEQAVQAAAVERENSIQWGRICDAYDVADHEANYRAVREWLENNITLERFRVFVETNPKNFTLDWKGTKEKLIADIVDLLHDPAGKRMSAFDLKNAERSMQFWPKARLRARLAELQYKQQLQPKTASEIRGDLVAHRKAEQANNPFNPFPRLPKTIWVNGAYVPLDANYIKNLSVFEIKRLRAVYSAEQVDARLHGDA